MASNLPQFTYRTDRETLDKLKVISEYNFRTVNKEVDLLVKRHIAEYEAEHGEIVVPEEE